MNFILPEFDYYADYYPGFISNLADEIVTTTAVTNDYEDTTIINSIELIQTTTEGKLSTIRCKFTNYLKINKKNQINKKLIIMLITIPILFQIQLMKLSRLPLIQMTLRVLP